MTSRDTTNADRPLPDCAVVRPHTDGPGVTVDKSVVEAVLDETDHGLIPDVRFDRASEELLTALVEAFDRVTPTMSYDIVKDRREAAETLRILLDTATPVYVARRRY